MIHLHKFSKSNIASASSSSSIPLLTPSPEDRILQLRDAMPISFNELKYATRNFHPDNILGEGQFGRVFKGGINIHTLTAAEPEYGMVVAIRRCNGMPGFKEWLEEMDYLSQFHHPNLIKLLAYCDDGVYKLLVFEFMPEGSLSNHLFKGGRQHLSWDKRIMVAIGAARGLSFFHDVGNKVTSKNFKSSNILLDEEFNVKLSDFGFAEAVRIPYETPLGSFYVPWDYIGYASPDYKASGYWSKERDVYAFGVVLLELLCGRQAFDRRRNLIDWVKPYLSNNQRVHKVMDPLLDVKYPHKGVLRFVKLALWCLSEDPHFGPNMAEVLAVLERIKGLS
ncbi:probable serine/threonine-protein kinase PBL3 isoform X1 [Olea europaea var. sylvestris]|uniref:probable serine/threonine-protein kinase PBL3 isoform X1 n=2 Tax=Olea europaea var. sylvestris TaxID=158386 RepID=UPI000C1D51ED|nr:probable serine/threonine-protein kinase PBL3 isoform X1 [Olea europaea var. sylvestris]